MASPPGTNLLSCSWPRADPAPLLLLLLILLIGIIWATDRGRPRISMARLHARLGPTAEAMEASAATFTLWYLWATMNVLPMLSLFFLLSWWLMFLRALRNLRANFVFRDLVFKSMA
uniref:Uncharacterized protein n=1 Tax=Opuntia streptacantha TaxID=393608 RepID=A0A7C9DLI2_OPUST